MWSYCKQLASNVELVTRKYKIISRQLGSFEVLFSRPAEVSVAMGEWATINFCPWWDNMSIRWLCFQWASTIKIQLSMLVWYKADIIISMKIN